MVWIDCDGPREVLGISNLHAVTQRVVRGSKPREPGLGRGGGSRLFKKQQ